MPSKILAAASIIATAGLLAACDPEPGTPEWCEMIKEKPAGDITANEASEFAKSASWHFLEEPAGRLLLGQSCRDHAVTGSVKG